MQKLTNEEARELINMLKHYAEKKSINFPELGNHIEFTVTGDTRANNFKVNIRRQRINGSGCTYQGRTAFDNTVLMRLDVNPTSVHWNPDGEKITGTHLHVYTEEYDDKYAVAFDPKSKDLFDICFSFF